MFDNLLNNRKQMRLSLVDTDLAFKTAKSKQYQELPEQET